MSCVDVTPPAFAGNHGSGRPRPFIASSPTYRFFLALPVATFFVGEHDAPDVIGQVSFQTAGCGSRALALGDFLVVLGATGTVRHPNLHHRDGVKRAVELPVPVAGQAEAVDVGAGGLYRRGAVVVCGGCGARGAVGTSGAAG